MPPSQLGGERWEVVTHPGHGPRDLLVCSDGHKSRVGRAKQVGIVVCVILETCMVQTSLDCIELERVLLEDFFGGRVLPTRAPKLCKAWR